MGSELERQTKATGSEVRSLVSDVRNEAFRGEPR